MNANTTKTADGFVFPESAPASTTGLMLSLARASRAVGEWARRRRTVTELGALTDRDLQDIGLTRADIPRLVRSGR